MKYSPRPQSSIAEYLHARQMYVCVMDRQGKKLVHTNVKNNDFDFFLVIIQPPHYRAIAIMHLAALTHFGLIEFQRNSAAKPKVATTGATLGLLVKGFTTTTWLRCLHDRTARSGIAFADS